MSTPDTGVWAGLANPPVLFFFLGAFAALVRSSLRVPRPVTKLLALYLLWSIGFQGGVKLAQGGLHQDAVLALGIGMLLACVIPISSFVILRRFLGPEDSAALAAAYGSISAVTFMTAATVLEARHIPFGGHMVAAMALMESPAIVVAVVMLRLSQNRARQGRGEAAGLPAQHADTTPPTPPPTPPTSWPRLLHEAFLNGPVLLLLGSMLIGICTSERGYAMFKPLCTDLFSGVLVFFLLDLGIQAARSIRDLLRVGISGGGDGRETDETRRATEGHGGTRRRGRMGTRGGAAGGRVRVWPLIAFGLLTPPIHAALALGLSRLADLNVGDTVLLMVLAGSASYIAVPAAIRLVIPKANPGLYIPLPLAVTFPFNVALGIPLYIWAATHVHF